MRLADLAARGAPSPWQDGGKIPWSDPGFSARMLREHLDQSHDRASRRLPVIDRQIGWIHAHVLDARPARVLDLGCGPGLYTERLAALGHACVGVNYSPASIEHARAAAERARLDCRYELADVRTGKFGRDFGAALVLSGELNTFPPVEASTVLAAVRRALSPGARLVLEVHREDFVRALGARGPSWFAAGQSVFADSPHVCLRESFWHERERAATERWLVAAGGADDWTVYASTTRAYADDEYAALLAGAGFGRPERRESLDPEARDPADGLFVLIARAEERRWS